MDSHSLPVGLVESLKHLPDCGVVGLLRHAERYAIPPGEFGNQISITETGIAKCELLAKNIANNLISLFTSPVKRCMQTANELVKVAKEPVVKQSSLLGAPGIFIDDIDKAHFYCLQHLPTTMVEHLLSDQPNPDGFCNSTYRAVDKLVQFLLINKSASGMSLFITHDSILSVVIGSIYNKVKLMQLWPDFLEGIFFWQTDEILHAVYRGMYKKILWQC